MASRAQYVQELLDEFGVDTLAVRQELERVVGELTVDVLSQNDCRFTRLSKTESITLAASVKSVRLPFDFATAKKTFHQVDSGGDFVAERDIVSEREFFRRKGDSEYTGSTYAYIVTNPSDQTTPGDYLVFDTSSTSARYFRFPYYRRPTEDDSDIIRNLKVIKEGARAHFTQYVGQERAATALRIYLSIKSGIKESPETRTTGMRMLPNKQVQKNNRRNHRIGRGG